MPGKPYTPPDLLSAIQREDWPEALCLACRLRSLGPQDAIIRSAWSAHRNPDFYREIGKDPEALLRAAIPALVARFADQRFKVGDRVLWTDPDRGLASGPGVIVRMDGGDIIALKMDDEGEVECFASELSKA